MQAITSYVWERPVEITGRFDAPTRRASQAVLADSRDGAGLTAGGGWQQFLSASAATITR